MPKPSAAGSAVKRFEPKGEIATRFSFGVIRAAAIANAKVRMATAVASGKRMEFVVK